MESEQLYAHILGVVEPWVVLSVELSMPSKVEVFVGLPDDGEASCSECGRVCPRHDKRRKSWRHLDTCQLQTILTADVPRTKCPEHGVRLMSVPWAGPGAKLTAMLEALVIDWLRVAPKNAVAEAFRLSWDVVDGVMARAVARGLERRKALEPKRLGVDETSFKKRHKYVTLVNDLDTGAVLHVADGRGTASLAGFLDSLPGEVRHGIKAIAMDMHAPYIAAAKRHIPDAHLKICFDKFHVAAALSKAIDQVRRAEAKELRSLGSSELVGTRYLWLQDESRHKPKSAERFADLKKSSLKTARAWAFKEAAMEVWAERRKGAAETMWEQVISWGRHMHLAPVARVAQTIKNHLDGIVRAQMLRVTNAKSEGNNTQIQGLKRRARGFRNQGNFKTAILFHLGQLDMRPAGLSPGFPSHPFPG